MRRGKLSIIRSPMINLLFRYFSRRFGRKRPTSDWTHDSTVPLSVDLDSGKFCGELPGCPLGQLSFLGPSKEPALYEPYDLCCYPSLGLQFYLAEAGRVVEGFDISICAEDPGWAAFAGRWTLHGQPVTVDATVTPEQLEELLGPASKKSEDQLSFARPECALRFEWEDGRLVNAILDEQERAQQDRT